MKVIAEMPVRKVKMAIEEILEIEETIIEVVVAAEWVVTEVGKETVRDLKSAAGFLDWVEKVIALLIFQFSKVLQKAGYHCFLEKRGRGEVEFGRIFKGEAGE